MVTTTIQISQSLKRKLESLKEFSRETYEDVISKFIPSKSKRKIEKEDIGWLLLAEKALAKDWLSKEEDKAWKNL